METTDVLALAASRPAVEVGDGEAVIRTGDTDPALYVLVSGTLEVRAGDATIARFDESGAIVGEIGLLLGVPATADVVAVGPTRVHRLDDAAELFASNPEFGRHLAVILAARLRRVTTFLADLQEQFADQRGALGAVPEVLGELLGSGGPTPQVGSERAADSPY